MQDTIDHQEREHSEHGMSGYNRWSNCHASVLASRGAPNRSSHAARLGTALHQIAEQCLRDGFDAMDFVSNTTVVEGETITLVEADLEKLQEYIDDCRATGADTDDVEVFIEVRFDLTALNPGAPMWGIVDFAAYSRKLSRLWIKDFKSGYLGVSAESGQLKGYAIGGTVFLGRDRPVKSIEASIVQPNNGGIKRMEYTPKDLAAWWKETKVHVAETLKPDAEFTPGSWCSFCPVAGSCKARAEADLAKVSMDFRKLMAGERPPQMETRIMTPEEMGAFYAMYVSLKDTALAVGKEIYRLEISGTDVPGWKLVDKRAFRRFIGEEAKIVGTLAKAGISPWTPQELITPPEAERRIVEEMMVGPGGYRTKKAAKEAAVKLMADFVEKKSSGVTLAPDADPRPARQTGDEFGEIPGDDTDDL